MAALAPAGIHPAVIWGVILGAEAPDSDVVVRYTQGSVSYLKNHRGPTHGLMVLPLQAAVIAGLLTWIWPEVSFGLLFGWTLLGCLSHVCFDFTNDYGTKGFWPFSHKRIAADVIPIIDLWLLGLIGGGWLIHLTWPGHRQIIFTVVWLVIIAYVLLRFWLHSLALRLLKQSLDLSGAVGEHTPPGSGWCSEQISIHPTLLSLTAWRYVVQMPGEYWTGLVHLNNGTVSKPTKARSQSDMVVKASLQGQMVSVFANWSRRPRAQVEQKDGLYHVQWSDARYEVEGYSPFTAYAWLDENLTLVDEGLGPKKPQGMAGEQIRRRLRLEMGREEP